MPAGDVDVRVLSESLTLAELQPRLVIQTTSQLRLRKWVHFLGIPFHYVCACESVTEQILTGEACL